MGKSPKRQKYVKIGTENAKQKIGLLSLEKTRNKEDNSFKIS